MTSFIYRRSWIQHPQIDVNIEIVWKFCSITTPLLAGGLPPGWYKILRAFLWTKYAWVCGKVKLWFSLCNMQKLHCFKTMQSFLAYPDIRNMFIRAHTNHANRKTNIRNYYVNFAEPITLYGKTLKDILIVWGWLCYSKHTNIILLLQITGKQKATNVFRDLHRCSVKVILHQMSNGIPFAECHGAEGTLHLVQ